MLTYVGKGYSPAFTANYDLIAERLSAGEDIVIVTGPDDICQPLLDAGDAHCLTDSVEERDRIAAEDLANLLARPVVAGQHFLLDAATLARERAAFAQGQVRRACGGCEWAGLCSEIAVDDFASVRVQRSSA